MRIMVDNLAVDIDNRTVRRGDEDIRLTAKEYEVLKYLALHKDKIVSRAELLEHVWDCDYDCFSNVVDVYIRFLRAKIDDGHEKKLIKTFESRDIPSPPKTENGVPGGHTVFCLLSIYKNILPKRQDIFIDVIFTVSCDCHRRGTAAERKTAV